MTIDKSALEDADIPTLKAIQDFCYYQAEDLNSSAALLSKYHALRIEATEVLKSKIDQYFIEDGK